MTDPTPAPARRPGTPARCEALTRAGICDLPTDSRGYCDRPRDHVTD